MRYILFGGQNYHKKGGGHDLKGLGDDPKKLEMDAHVYDYVWWHIYDTETKGIIKQIEPARTNLACNSTNGVVAGRRRW